MHMSLIRVCEKWKGIATTNCQKVAHVQARLRFDSIGIGDCWTIQLVAGLPDCLTA